MTSKNGECIGTPVSGLEYTDEEKYLFSLVTGFLKSKILTTALQYDLFYYLDIRPRTRQELQNYLKFSPRSLDIFLDALLNIKLIYINTKNRFQNTGMSNKYLIKDKLAYIGGSVELFDSTYDSCSEMKSILEKGLHAKRTYSYLFSLDLHNLQRSEVEDYYHEMHYTSGHPAMSLTEFCDFEESEVVLDIGSGSGKMCQNLVSQYSHLEAILFDLPAVCEMAEEELKDFWLSHRIQIHPGDFFKNDFPEGFDTAVMMRITQDWSLDRTRLLFQKVYDNLPSGGKLVIYEIFRDDNPKVPGDAAMVSLLLFINTPEGRCRTKSEMKALLEEVGFSSIEFINTIYIYNAVTAIKP